MPDEKSRLVYSTDKVLPRKENPAEKAPQVKIPPFSPYYLIVNV